MECYEYIVKKTDDGRLPVRFLRGYEISKGDLIYVTPSMSDDMYVLRVHGYVSEPVLAIGDTLKRSRFRIVRNLNKPSFYDDRSMTNRRVRDKVHHA